jgi:UPF0755 protein
MLSSHGKVNVAGGCVKKPLSEQHFYGFLQSMKKKWLIAAIVASVLILFAVIAAYQLFSAAFDNQKTVRFRARKSWNLERLAEEMEKQAGLKNKERLIFWLKLKGYRQVKSCTIDIQPGANINSIADLLMKNRNQTVNVTILGSMDAQSLARAVASKTEVNADSFLNILKSETGLKSYGFNDTTWAALFIPNTYNMYAATEIPDLLKRMEKEYERFWNSKRIQRSIVQKLTCKEVITLASIVTKESNKTAEYENIAGVYLNRLRKGMLLQADPTVVFARGYTGRVWAADLKINSPYNTYIHQGLPPGPLCIPNRESIEAVLNYSSHDYLFFCAKADGSGYHSFAKTLEEHNKNAADFHRWLNEKGIK